MVSSQQRPFVNNLLDGIIKNIARNIGGMKFAPKSEPSIMDEVISAHSAQIKA